MMTNETNVRRLALQTLLDCEKNGKYSNIAVDATLKKAALTDADASLYTALVYGVEERQITLDHVLSGIADGGLSHIEPRVLCILRLGLYQLIYLCRIPPHAAVNESVALCRNRGERGFVNAILRNYQRKREAIALFPEKGSVPLPRYLSVRYAFPEWICASLAKDYGDADAEGILCALSDGKPRLTLRVNTLKTTRADLAARLQKAGFSPKDTPYSPVGLILPVGVGNVSSLPGFADGEFFIQDEASQLHALLLSPKCGERIIDTCACPGSKSFGAAILSEDKAEIHAFDLHENKLSLVRASAGRLGITSVTTGACDAREPLPALIGQADRVICDVPCSGFGVMAKKQDIRYRSQKDIEKLGALGKEILLKSADYLKVGGTLVFSTCTLRKEENEETVLAFLRERKDFAPVPFRIPSSDPALPEIVSDGWTTLFPHIHMTDGFFFAKLTRKA